MIDCHICQVREAISLRVPIRGGGVFPLCERCRGMHGVYPARKKSFPKSKPIEVPKCLTQRRLTFI